MENKGWLERKIVNKDDGRQILEMGASVNFVVVDMSNYVLLGTQQRAVYKSKGIFGGYVDKGETSLEAMYRELKEETNIDKKDILSVARIYEDKFVSEGYTSETNSLYIILVNNLFELQLQCNDIGEDIKLEICDLSTIDPHKCNGVKAFIALNCLHQIKSENDMVCRFLDYIKAYPLHNFNVV